MHSAMNTIAGQTAARTQLMFGSRRGSTYPVYRRGSRPGEVRRPELPLPGTPGRGQGRGAGPKARAIRRTTSRVAAAPLPNPLPGVPGRGSKRRGFVIIDVVIGLMILAALAA